MFSLTKKSSTIYRNKSVTYRYIVAYIVSDGLSQSQEDKSGAAF